MKNKSYYKLSDDEKEIIKKFKEEQLQNMIYRMIL